MTVEVSSNVGKMGIPTGGILMHALKGRKQSKWHVAKRMAAMLKRAELTGKWPGGGPPRYTPETLWANVLKSAEHECWPWTGMKNAQGYGRVQLDGKNYYAHRVIYDLQNPGKITRSAPKKRDQDGFLRHICDNPICCNPSHLLVGTHADNMKDKVVRGRSRWFNSSLETPRAKLSADDVRAIRITVKTRRESGIGPSNPELCIQYGVSQATIQSVVIGRHYRDVP